MPSSMQTNIIVKMNAASQCGSELNSKACLVRPGPFSIRRAILARLRPCVDRVRHTLLALAAGTTAGEVDRGGDNAGHGDGRQRLLQLVPGLRRHYVIALMRKKSKKQRSERTKPEPRLRDASTGRAPRVPNPPQFARGNAFFQLKTQGMYRPQPTMPARKDGRTDTTSTVWELHQS